MSKQKSEIWIRHRDTGAVRSLTAAQWKHDGRTLRAEGFAPCAEDGSPTEEGAADDDQPDGSSDTGTGAHADDAGAADKPTRSARR